jgi:hypothetical protein
VVLLACAAAGASGVTLAPLDLPPDLAVRNTQARAMAAAERAAYEARDVGAVLALFADDVVHVDRTFGVEIRGRDAVGEMLRGFLATFSNTAFEERHPPYVGVDGFLTSVAMHPVRLRGRLFTAAAPLVEVDRYVLDEDGRVVTWQLFYTFATLRGFADLNPARLGGAEAIVAAYVAALEAAQSGRSVTVLDTFADTARDPTVGARLILQEPRAGGTTCDVGLAVLLETTEGRVTRELRYVDVESLTACGWLGDR